MQENINSKREIRPPTLRPVSDAAYCVRCTNAIHCEIGDSGRGHDANEKEILLLLFISNFVMCAVRVCVSVSQYWAVCSVPTSRKGEAIFAITAEAYAQFVFHHE